MNYIVNSDVALNTLNSINRKSQQDRNDLIDTTSIEQILRRNANMGIC